MVLRCARASRARELRYDTLWKGLITGIRGLTKIQCLIRENLDGIRDLITTREAGFAKIRASMCLGKKMIFVKEDVEDAGFS